MRFYNHLYIAVVIHFISFGFSACSDGTMGKEGTGDVQFRMKNWKWYEYKEKGYTLYSKDSSNEGAITKHTGVQLPFFDDTSPAGKVLFRSNRTDVDMFPEDGWVLIKADFGTITKAPNMPYFLLYNRATATLRYVFYNSKEYNDHSYAMVNLVQINGTSSILSFFDNEDCFTNDYDADKTLTTITGVISRDWSFADFVIAYDSAVTEKKNLCLYLTVHIIDESEIMLEGDITLNQVLGNGQVHSSGNISTGDLITAGKKGVLCYKDSKKFFIYCNASSGTWYSDLLNDIGSISSLAGGSIVPWIGVIAGIFSSGIFGSKESQPVPLNYMGDIILNETIKKIAPIDGFEFNVPGVIVDSDYHGTLSYYNKALGIFSIKSKPVVDVTVTTYDVGEFTEGVSQNIWSFLLNVSNVELHDNYFPEIVCNEIDGYYIKSVELGYVFSNETSIDFRYDGSELFEDTYSSYEANPVRVHEENPVEFAAVDNFLNGNLCYSQKYGRSWQDRRLPASSQLSNSEKIFDIKTIASVVAPEIAIKVIMYSVKDTDKKNPIIHLKRVMADYNIYWYNADTDVTTNLGFFEN